MPLGPLAKAEVQKTEDAVARGEHPGALRQQDNGHEDRHLMPMEEGETVLTICTIIGGRLHYHQRAFTRVQIESATAYNELAHTVSRMLSTMQHARTDFNRQEQTDANFAAVMRGDWDAPRDPDL